jgi:hypothetical protein
MSMDGESYLKLFSKSTRGNVYVTVIHMIIGVESFLKLLSKSTGRNVHENVVTHEHGW